MKKTLLIIGSLIIIGLLTLWMIGPMNAMIWMVKPHHNFENDTRVESPDYSEIENWAALPEIEDLSDMKPEGTSKEESLKGVDVFFIHPTGYLRGDHWNSILDKNSGTEQNTKWMLANQASAFSDANVYAPRYREATIYVFFNREGKNEKAALDLAYSDVEKAFDYFIQYYNQERPFIIASHSQGTYHALPLLKNRIDKTDLADRMIAAYLVGMSTITKDAVAELENITVCENPIQNKCLVHWATFAEGTPETPDWGKSMICVNPISWKRDGKRVESKLHKGYVKTSGEYNLSVTGKDLPTDDPFESLGPIQAEHTFAQCVEGRLLVMEQEGASDAMGKGNYHGLDYQLFHLDIRKNVSDRTRAFFEAKMTAETAL